MICLCLRQMLKPGNVFLHGMLYYDPYHLIGDTQIHFSCMKIDATVEFVLMVQNV